MAEAKQLLDGADKMLDRHRRKCDEDDAAADGS
jgi:hypothetical protein